MIPIKSTVYKITSLPAVSQPSVAASHNLARAIRIQRRRKGMELLFGFFWVDFPWGIRGKMLGTCDFSLEKMMI